MIGVVAYWSVHPYVTAQASGVQRWNTHYTYPMRTLNATHYFLVNLPSDSIPFSTSELTYVEYACLEDILTAYPSANYVVLTNTYSGTALRNYTHPSEDVIYVTGSDYGDVEMNKFDGYTSDTVNIEVPNSTPQMYAHHASAIALYDRYVKTL